MFIAMTKKGKDTLYLSPINIFTLRFAPHNNYCF